MKQKVRNKNTDIDNVLPPVAELIKTAKHTKLIYTNLDGESCKFDYKDLVTLDPYPIPMPIDREGYGSIDNSHHHWATGYGDWLNVKTAIDRFGIKQANKNKLFDFGCASGRFLRHVDVFSDLEAHGCDFAPANVNWVKRHLSSKLEVIQNSADTSLPYDDGYFDVVTAFSVLTHIDEEEEDWLIELRRITHPEGLLYITTQNEAAWKLIPNRPGSLAHLKRANQLNKSIDITPEIFQKGLPEDRMVFHVSTDDVYNCNVWHTNNYIKNKWSKHFDILQIADNAHTGFQSPVIMRPK